MTEAKLRRIAFVTRHYTDLRAGVVRAFLAPYGMGVIGVLEWFEVFTLLPMLLMIVGVVPAYLVVDRWVNRRFGRVHAVNLSFLQVSESTVCLVAWMLANRFDDANRFTSGWPSMAFVAVAAYALWICVRLRPFAFHYLLPMSLAIGFAFTFADVRDTASLYLWQRNAYCATLLGWTAAGVIDLALLMRVLPNRGAAGIEEGSHADAI